MKVQNLLPKTSNPILLAAVGVFTVGCFYSAGWLVWQVAFKGASPISFVFAGLLGWLAYGVWRLKSIAQKVAVTLLVIAFFFTLLGVPGVLMESRTSTKVDVYVWVTPIAVLEFFCAYAFQRHKQAFGLKRGDHPH